MTEKSLRIPTRLPDWVELNRRVSNHSRSVLSRLDSAEDRLAILETLIVELVPAGYGGMNLQSPVANFTIPTTGYQELIYDTETLTPSRGVVMRPATNDFYINVAGNWRYSASFNLAGHNSSNDGQTFELRLYDEDAGTGTPPVYVGVGRNQEDTLVTMTTIFNISEAAEGHLFHLEVGESSLAFTGTLSSCNLAMNFVSEVGSIT